jgi:cyanophycin synthetase
MELLIKELRVMSGPNTWSRRHQKLIVVKLAAEGKLELTQEEIVREVAEYVPGLKNKSVSDKLIDLTSTYPDLFLVHLYAMIASEIQNTIGSSSNYYNSHLLGKDSLYAVFCYDYEEVGKEAAQLARELLQNILDDRKVPYKEIIEDLKEAYSKAYLGPSTASIVNAAVKKGIPYRILLNGKYISFGYGNKQKRIEASISENTSTIGVDLVKDKDDTKVLLDDVFIPVPKGKLVRDIDELEAAAEEIGYPLVTKPLDGHHGEGIYVDIKNYDELVDAFERTQEISDDVILEKYIKGQDFRVLVVGYKMIAAALRKPASVIGDGRSTVYELIQETNTDSKRGEGHENILTRIEIDDVTRDLLKDAGLNLDSVPKKGQEVFLKETANISTGGTATDVTDEVHPDNIFLFERIAGRVGLDICGIDIVASDLRTPLVENGGAILEVNAAPGLRMHLSPSSGKARDVGKSIIDYMFPDTEDALIPIIAITGTNGKTTTSRLMAAVVSDQGYNVGYTTTDGIYIKDKLIAKGDFTGPKSTQIVLSEPFVDFAVLECARGGIIRSGLGFNSCDIGIVTNVAEDHLGLKDINTVEDLAYVKAVIPNSVKTTGYAILNADDPLVYKMAESLKCNVAFFSLDENSDKIREHCKSGGIAAVLTSEGSIEIHDGIKKINAGQVDQMPITLGGTADFMIQNVMPVLIASYVSGFDMDKVQKTLYKFQTSAATTPGRLNFFDFEDFKVIVDYAHNPHSFEAFGRMLKKISGRKTGIITGVGDRRSEDLVQIGKISAEMYDDIIIRIDTDTRGRSPEEIVELVSEGIRSVSKTKKYKVIPDAQEALEYAINNACEGCYIIISAEDVKKTIEIVQELQSEFVHK